VVEQNLKEFWQLQKISAAAKSEEQTSAWQTIYDCLLPGGNSTLTSGIVGVNLGKNKTSTTALEDYQTLIRQLGPYADYLVINVSSPNTPGLRDLQGTSPLEGLLSGCQGGACRKLPQKTPLLVKLSPDLSIDELKDISKLLMKLEIDGIVLTNTTIARPAGLVSSNKNETGGLTGAPLKNRSTECIHLLDETTKGQIPIIGVGRVQNGHDAYEKLRAGASLVQVYSGMIYGGPGIVSKIRDEVAELMIQNGQRNLQEEVVGSAHEQLHWERQRALLEKRNSATTTLVIDQEDGDSEDQQEGTVSHQHKMATEGE
jgi:dihydroorotate dehydrogenase